MNLSYISIVTDRLDALKDFYVGALGLVELADWSHEGFRAIQVEPGVIVAFHSPAAMSDLGIDAGATVSSMLTFDPGSVDELRRLHDELGVKGVPVVREPFDTPYGSLQTIYRDLDGNPFRLNTFAT